MGNNITYGLQVMLIGMLVVFVSLVVLSYVMVLLNKLVGDKPVKQSEEKHKTQNNTNAEKDRGTKGSIKKEESSSEELVAVVAAAIASYLDVRPEDLQVRIIRRRHTQGTSAAWSLAGRQETMNARKL